MRPRTQNEEALILRTLLSRFDIPKCFVESASAAGNSIARRSPSNWKACCWMATATMSPSRRLSSEADYPAALDHTRNPRSSSRICARPRHESVDRRGRKRYWFSKTSSLAAAIIISNIILRSAPGRYRALFAFIQYREAHASGTYYGASLTALCHWRSVHARLWLSGWEPAGSMPLRSVRSPGADDRPLDPQHANREQMFWDLSGG